MTIDTVRVTMIARKEKVDGYIIGVFKIDNTGSYIMCSVFPKWQGYIPQIGDTGFLTYKEIVPGEDHWVNKDSGDSFIYTHFGVYFENFVKDTADINMKMVL